MTKYRIVPCGTCQFEIQQEVSCVGVAFWRPVNMFCRFSSIEGARQGVKTLIADAQQTAEHAKTPIEYYEG